MAAHESAYAAAARAREAGDAGSLRDALTYQVHLGDSPGPAPGGRRVCERARLRGGRNDERRPTRGTRGARVGRRAPPRRGVVPLADRCGRSDRRRIRCHAVGGNGRRSARAPRGPVRRSGRVLRGEAVPQLSTGGDPLAAAVPRRTGGGVREIGPQRTRARDSSRRWSTRPSQRRSRVTSPLRLRMRAVARSKLTDFDSALEQHGRWGNRFEEARTRLLYGEALRRAKRRKEAREQLSAATSAFGAVGATAWKRRARDELRASGARLPRPASGSSLTAQEQRVANLVVDGLSNNEIASRLVISTKTVEGHLRNIFEKLGVTSRTQVRAASRGLGRRTARTRSIERRSRHEPRTASSAATRATRAGRRASDAAAGRRHADERAGREDASRATGRRTSSACARRTAATARRRPTSGTSDGGLSPPPTARRRRRVAKS